MKVDDVSFTPLMIKTITITTAKTAKEAKAIAAETKNEFKTLCSFCLYPIVIPKQTIDWNIKNSTIIRIIIKGNKSVSEKFPEIAVDKKYFIVSKKVGEINIIKIEIIKQANPQRSSIRLVKYFELTSSFLVTGRV